MKKLFCLFTFILGIQTAFAQSQYFGQNKPRYKTFGFKILQSPHFELYHYFKDNKIPNDIVVNSEYWYKLHQDVFKLSFIQPNPLIIYKNHPDFQETTAIMGNIGEGTGGVTEGLRNRVVMPIMYSKRQTDHVLGHELVHAFQYQLMTAGSDSTSLANIGNLPLFMVEGLAEYMSIGRIDGHTAMWMRDAVQNDDIPTIKDLITKEYKYFPYRWGQAFWAYITATYGDDIIRPLFKETAKYGVEVAFTRNLKLDTERFSVKWKKALQEAYNPLKEGKIMKPIGKEIASPKTGGDMNISPTISPDGNFIAYISSKSVISLDVFIADARTGKTIRKIESTSFGSHVDSYSFLETAGTWSPDSRYFALVVQVKGRNKLSIIDVANGNKKTYEINGVDSFTNPTWSPDGNSIVVSGLMEGNSDLYKFNIKDDSVLNLTKDDYSDIQPTWSPEGRYIYFVSDRGNQSPRLEKTNFSISRIDVNSLAVETYKFFSQADNLNPLIDPTGRYIYFLSDADGFRNLYRYMINEGNIDKMTNFYTGISGITVYSPAISIASKTGAMAYTHFLNGKYTILSANESDFTYTPVNDKVDKKAATLAPMEWKEGRDIVQNNLEKQNLNIKIPTSNLKTLVYKPKFKLDYLANSGLGVSTSRWGTGVGGGVVGLFTDMLNNNLLSGTVALNGEIQDFGGQFFYMNQKSPLQWGASVSRIPYRFFDFRDPGEVKFLGKADKQQIGMPLSDSLYTFTQNLYRIFINEVGVFAFYPFSTSKRLEGGVSANWYSYSGRAYTQYYGLINGQRFTDYYIGEDNPRRVNKERLETLGYSPFNMQQFYLAYVGDNTTFGLTSPLNGYRYRIEASKFLGTIAHTSYTVDLRKYKFIKPVTLAGRFLYTGRLGLNNVNTQNRLFPLDLSFPWYMHGFWGNAGASQVNTFQILSQQLEGTQLAVANFEVRVPFTGPKKLALIEFNYVPSDLNFFIDSGLAWDDNRKIGQEFTYTFNEGLNVATRKQKVNPIFTTGMSIRINALGYLILEPYFAVPIYQNEAGKYQKMPVVTGINFMVPGW